MSISQLPQLLFIGFKNTFFESLSGRFPKNALDLTFVDISSISTTNFSENTSYDYIVIDCFSEEFGSLEFLRSDNLFSFIEKENEKQNRILILLPQTVSSEMGVHLKTKLDSLLLRNKTLGVLFVARLLDTNLFSYFPLDDNNTVELPSKSSLLSFIHSEDARIGIERCIFSLKAYGHTQSLYGIVTKASDIGHLFEQKGYTPIYNDSIQTDVLTANEVILKPFSMEKVMAGVPAVEIIENLSPSISEPAFFPEPENPHFPLTESVQTGSFSPSRKPKRSFHFPKLKRTSKKIRFPLVKGISLAFIFFLVLLLPYLLSSLSLFLAVSTAKFEKSSLSSFFLPLSEHTAQASESISSWYSDMSGDFYRDALSVSRVSYRLTHAARSYSTASNVSDLLEAIATGKDLSNDTTSQTLLFAHETVYSDLGFALSELDNLTFSHDFVKRLVDTKTIAMVRDASLTAKTLLHALGSVTGQQKPVVYGVVFEDFNALRPAGGKITGVSLATFDHGSLSQIEDLDLESATKNFDGVVTPPYAISTYLGKQNWDLTEANWDYSYPEAAEKMSWFIDKEFDRKVDGVITVSTSLGKQGLTDLLSKKDSTNVQKLQTLLEDKQILLSTPSDSANSAFTDFGWNDSFANRSCNDNCISDRFAVNESNMGGANPHIKREGSFQVLYQDNGLKRGFTYYIKNEGSEEYKTYVRLVVPQDSDLEPVTLLNEEGKKTLESHVFGQREDKEDGVYVVIPAGKTIGIEYAWKSSPSVTFDAKGSYELFILRQPGVSAYPLDLEVSFPHAGSLSYDSPFQLTKEGAVHYNTVLGADLNSSVSWK